MLTKPKNLVRKQDLQKIRKLLPYDWRLQIAQGHPQITPRLISETFYLRTRNADSTEIVFGMIAKMLDALGEKQLAEKCQNRIQLCRATQLKPAA